MYVIDLMIKRKKVGNIERILEGYFKKDCGLIGDVNALGGDRQVSIATDKVRTYIEKGNLRGICFDRFYENITIKGLNFDKLYIGQRVVIGETIQEITVMKKKCYPECNLLKSNNPCPLSKEVLFTRIIKGGHIKIGDKVDITQYANSGDEFR